VLYASAVTGSNQPKSKELWTDLSRCPNCVCGPHLEINIRNLPTATLNSAGCTCPASGTTNRKRKAASPVVVCIACNANPLQQSNCADITRCWDPTTTPPKCLSCEQARVLIPGFCWLNSSDFATQTLQYHMVLSLVSRLSSEQTLWTNVCGVNSDVLVLPMAVCVTADVSTPNFRHVHGRDKIPSMIAPAQIAALVSELRPGYTGHMAFLVICVATSESMSVQEDGDTTEVTSLEEDAEHSEGQSLLRYTSQDAQTVCVEYLLAYPAHSTLYWSVVDDAKHVPLYLGCGKHAAVVNAEVNGNRTCLSDHAIVVVVDTTRRSLTVFNPQPFEGPAQLPCEVTEIARLTHCNRVNLLSGRDTVGVCGAWSTDFLYHLAEQGIPYVASNEHAKVCVLDNVKRWTSTNTDATATFKTDAVSVWTCVTCLGVRKVGNFSVPEVMKFSEGDVKTLRFLVIRQAQHWLIYIRVRESVWVEHDTIHNKIHLHCAIFAKFMTQFDTGTKEIYMAWYGPKTPDWTIEPCWGRTSKTTFDHCTLTNNGKDCSIEVVLFALCQIKHETEEKPEEKTTSLTTGETDDFSQLIVNLMQLTNQLKVIINSRQVLSETELSVLTCSQSLWKRLRDDVRLARIDKKRAKNNEDDAPTTDKAYVLETNEFTGY
jgi:hypothetical protein